MNAASDLDRITWKDSAYAKCTECGFAVYGEPYPAAARKAREHARETDHVPSVYDLRVTQYAQRHRTCNHVPGWGRLDEPPHCIHCKVPLEQQIGNGAYVEVPEPVTLTRQDSTEGES